MALLKKIEQENGIIAEYHKISNVNLEKLNTEYSVGVTVDSFHSQKVREKSTGFKLYSTEYRFYIPAEIVENQPVIKHLYDELKKTSMFEEAEDC